MEKYKYKNSGIEWLGKIPKHWEITKIKKEFKVQHCRLKFNFICNFAVYPN